jgi:fucose 4-O-acetylase-like acetyltransferase
LILSATFLLLMHMVYGWFIFPLNVLFSIIVIRIVLNPVMRFMYQSRAYFWLTLFGLFIALIPSLFWMEYGTLGLLIALYGAAIRRDQDVQQGACLLSGDMQERARQTPMDLKVLYIVVLVMFYTATLYLFHFDRMQMAVMIIVCALVLHVLSRLEVCEVRGRFSPLVSSTLRWIGRHTLMIYVVHLTCFHIIVWGVSAGSLPHRFGQWEWTIIEAYAAKSKSVSAED